MGVAALIAIEVFLAFADEPAGQKKDGVPPTDFIRFVETARGEGKLETAIVTFKNAEGASVDLIAAVHVADKAYYDGLKVRFKSYDQLLYELVSSKDDDLDDLKKSTNPLSAFQRLLKSSLGLEFQLDAIDYKAKNFVHADLDPETFLKLQAEKGESILGLLFKAALKGFELQAKGESQPASGIEILAALASSDSQRKLKMIFARELEGMEKVLAGIEEGTKDGSVLVVERNKAALEALKKGLAGGSKRFGIFYGAGHMQDLEARLTRDLGFKKSKEEWVTAWDVRRKKSEVPKEENAKR